MCIYEQEKVTLAGLDEVIGAFSGVPPNKTQGLVLSEISAGLPIPDTGIATYCVFFVCVSVYLGYPDFGSNAFNTNGTGSGTELPTFKKNHSALPRNLPFLHKQIRKLPSPSSWSRYHLQVIPALLEGVMSPTLGKMFQN